MSSNHTITRRDFVKLCGALTIAASAPVVLTPLAEAAQKANQYHQTLPKMGTTVTITVVTASEDQARQAIGAAWTEMDRQIAVFDRHHAGTSVFELNRAGFLSDPTPEMLEVLDQAAEVYRLSGGAFDPTVLPLLDVIEKSFASTGQAPSEPQLAEALKKVDFEAVEYTANGIRLNRSGQEISLDGVAKGYIVDRAGAALRHAGGRERHDQCRR